MVALFSTASDVTSARTTRARMTAVCASEMFTPTGLKMVPPPFAPRTRIAATRCCSSCRAPSAPVLREALKHRADSATASRLYHGLVVYIGFVAKRLIDIDEEALRAARAELGTQTIKETVNRALRQAGGDDRARVKRSLDRLSRAQLAAREDAWR